MAPWLHLAPTPPSGQHHLRAPSREEHWLLAEEATAGWPLLTLLSVATGFVSPATMPEVLVGIS
jgi:hypothetical protein